MKQYQKLTVKAVIQLAAPHTWAASIFPVLVGTSLAYALRGTSNIPFTLLLLICAILMQSAVNCVNDYIDFVKGTDTAENCLDAADAALIYHDINPKAALYTSFVMLGIAFIPGLFLITQTGLTLLWIGLIGTACIFLYSVGPLPISYTPFGELTSGFVMGGLIAYATYFAITLEQSVWIFYYAAPTILTISLIMMTNNTCDIPRDKDAHRHTLPVLLGEKAASFLLPAGYVLTLLAVAHLAFWEYRWGLLAFVPMVIHTFPSIKSLFTMDFNHITRITAMKTALKLAYLINIYYILIILLGVWIGG